MTYVFPFKIIGLTVVFVGMVPGYCFKTVLWLLVGLAELPIKEGATVFLWCENKLFILN